MMFRIFILIIGFAFVGLGNVYSQSNYKEVTRKELLEKSTFHDTITEYNYHTNGNVQYKAVMYNMITTVEGAPSSISGYIKEEEFRSNGLLKKEYFHDNGLLIRYVEYDSKGNKSYDFIYEHKNPDDILYRLGNNYYTSKNSTTYTLLSYYKGKLILRAYYLNGKKNGLWEYYNNWSGILTKKITWKVGKKMHVEKIDNKSE